MKTSTTISRHGFAVVLLTLSVPGFAQKVVIDKVETSVQPVNQNEFQLHFEFQLPDFGKTDLKNLNVDLAVLSFELTVLASSSSGADLIEILAASDNRKDPRPNLPYNENPVTGAIMRKQMGVTRVEVNITQLVRKWLFEGLDNHGLLLVSHRRLNDLQKALRVDKLEVRTALKPAVTIYYTGLGE